MAGVFGLASGSGTGYLFSLLTRPFARLRLQNILPGSVLDIDAAGWLSFGLLVAALLVLPALTILLAGRRTFGWPLLPLASFFACLTLGGVHSTSQAANSSGPMLLGGCTLALLAWVPFSRTVLFSGNRRLADDKSCGPRALYLVCQALGMRVTLRQVRRLTKITARGTTAAHLERATVALELSSERVSPDSVALVQMRTPAVAFVNWGWGSEDHAIAVLAIGKNRVHIHDPNYPWEKIISLQRLIAALRYDLLLLSRLDIPSPLIQDSVWPPPSQHNDHPKLV